MFEFICLFLPAFISIFSYESLTDKKLDLKKSIIFYSLFNILINATLWGIIYLFFNRVEVIFTLAFSIKYLLLSSIVSIIMPILIVAFENNFSLRIRVKNQKNK